MKNKILENFLTSPSIGLGKQQDSCLLNTQELDLSDVVFYRIDSVTFKKDSPRREALENVLSALRIEGISFVYLILGTQSGVEFYYGVVRDYSKPAPLLNIDEIGKMILEPSIRGNFRGSKIEAIKGIQKRAILEKIKNNQYQSVIDGVPGIIQDENEFQGVERLIDVMSCGQEFGLMIIASFLDDTEISKIENNIFETYSTIAPISKQNKQESTAKNFGTSITTTKGDSTSKTDGTNKTFSKGTSWGSSKTSTISNSESKSEGKNQSVSKGTSSGTSETSNGSSRSSGTNQSGTESSTVGTNSNITYSGSHSQGETRSEGGNEGESNGTNSSTTTGINTSSSEGKNEGGTDSSSISVEVINKQMQDWLKYIDEILLPRVDYGKGKGIFVSSMFCFSDSQATLKRLENTVISLFSGENGNKIPLRACLLKKGQRLQALKNLQLPNIILDEKTSKVCSIFSQSPDRLGNWMSSKELSLIAGLPKKDVIGLELREEVEFGLNFPQIVDSESLVLGKLMQSGNITNKNVGIANSNLDKHIFITGVTGSGKTTTCQNILIQSNLPFLVIEPAKTEYRILKEKYDDLLIFTLGKDTVAPFRLNPFEFFPHESITSRVDMIKASIEAAFDMEAAIPQIIESAIYECYKEKGWNIATNQNEIYGENAFDDGIYSFPTLEDLVKKVEEVVKKQGFDERLKNDYIGSIRARLNGLLVGSKGFMLNTKRSIDFRKLLNQRVVLEIEEIRNGSEKSLVMGFVLSNVIEAIKANFIASSKKNGVRHIILIEEAHRLLSKFQAGDSPNKKQGVEVFADMLAEIRKYGECLMIADQIPNKLTPEVLKNTNTKIVHRLFAEDDKEAIANTMALEEEQKEFLSKLDAGVAVVFSGGFNKAIATKISQASNTTSDLVISEEDLQENVYKFYANSSKSGVILGSSWLDHVGTKEIALLLDLQRRSGLMKEIKKHWIENQKIGPKLLKSLQIFADDLSLEFLSKYFLLENDMSDKKLGYAKEFLEKYLNNGFKESDVRYFNDELF